MSGLFVPLHRTTLWIPETGPTSDPHKGHLFVVLTDPCPEGAVLLVPICSQYERCDKTCLVGAGDHPFLKHPSFVFYARLKTYVAAELVESEKAGNVTYRGLLDERLFGFICAGVERSPFSPLKFRAYFSEQIKRPKGSQKSAKGKSGSK